MQKATFKWCKASSVKVGDRVFSDWIGEFFIVQKIEYNGDYIHFIEDSFTLKTRISSNVKVAVKS